MERFALNIGTRDEIAAELDQYGADRAAHGKEERAREIARALHAIADEDADMVRVGRAIYAVAGSYVARDLQASEQGAEAIKSGHADQRVTGGPRPE